MSKQIKIVHVSDDNCDVSLNVGSINGVQKIAGKELKMFDKESVCFH